MAKIIKDDNNIITGTLVAIQPASTQPAVQCYRRTYV